MSEPIKAANSTSGHCTPANVLTMSDKFAARAATSA